MNNQKEVKPTRAEKITAVKNLIRGLLEKTNFKHNELIDEASRLYAESFGGEENPNDIKGRIGSILDVMKKDGEVVYEGGVYALKKEETPEQPVETKKKQTRTRAKKTEEVETEQPVKKRTTKKAQAKKEQPLPPAPLQPIAPVAPITPEIAPEPIPEEKPKKRGRKAKEVKEEVQTPTVQEETAQQPKMEVTEVVKEEPVKAEEPVKTEEAVKAEEQPKGTLMDMSFLLGDVKKTQKEEPKQPQKAEEKPKTEEKELPKTENKPEPKKQEKPLPKAETVKKETPKAVEKKNEQQNRRGGKGNEKKTVRAMTAEEKLQEAFLTRLRRLGGEYFEYYSVYLLERYSRMNGRRLEALRVTGGEHDGGIDGEIELTDRLGFRETIYIQSKNWNPDKGDEKLWVVGETLLQQFIGACVCRQAKDGKQHCRGIFMTTSRFTPEAKRILEETADKYVGYDGADVFETAKECQFGIVKKNGEWTLDEELLAGEKSFFRMF